MPKAYSYLRFSTPEQLKGDSFRRQMEQSLRYAQDHGLELDDTLTYHDLGLSAYHGKHITEGALGQFINAVDSGAVAPGSYLLVESLDRLSRETVMSAFRHLSDILQRGVVVVTLRDGRVYTAETLNTSFGGLIYSLTIMHSAHEESARKSHHLSQAWAAKRNKARADGKPLTACAPAWLTLDKDTSTFEVIPDRAALIKRIYSMTIDGDGKTVIARTFNQEGIKPWGRGKGWHASYIQKILENEAVIGVFQPMKTEVVDGRKGRKRTPDGEPIEDYFPAVISRETYLKAQQQRKQRRIPSGPKGQGMSNLFTGLTHCGHCGAPMHFVNKGKGLKYLVCSNAKRGVGDCRYLSWRYKNTEMFIIIGLSEIDFSELQPEIKTGVRQQLAELEGRKLDVEDQIAKAKQAMETLLDHLENREEESAALLDRLTKREAEEAELQKTLIKVQDRIDLEQDRLAHSKEASQEAQEAMTRWIAAQRSTQPEVAYNARSKMAGYLKRLIGEITFFSPDGEMPRRIEITLKDQPDYKRIIELTRDQAYAESHAVVDGKPAGRETGSYHMQVVRKKPDWVDES